VLDTKKFELWSSLDPCKKTPVFARNTDLELYSLADRTIDELAGRNPPNSSFIVESGNFERCMSKSVGLFLWIRISDVESF
jgi:hypothetical protein